MRLTCPNCGAQYEVPDAVIPVSGRDVQCSNCGNTWFQQHADHTPPEFDPSTQASDGASTPQAEDTQDPPRAPRAAAATQRGLDPEVADILREEAERERAVRAAEAGSRLETQPDLGLDASDSALDERGQQARARMDRLRGEPPPEAAAPETRKEKDANPEIDPSSRRNLFPDIDEINSSLNAEKANGEGTSPSMPPEQSLPAPRASGFRTGFRLAVIICVLALIVYVMAPRIAVLVPATGSALAQYVEAVDALRAMLNNAVTSLLSRL